MGEGWGEGLAGTATYPPHLFSFFLYALRPHPDPLPEGEGIRKLLTNNFLGALRLSSQLDALATRRCTV